MNSNSKSSNNPLGLVVGQKVWVNPSGLHRVKRDPYEATISKVGRKYFELEGECRRKYRLSNGIEHNETNYKSKVYTDIQQILDEQEHSEVQDELRKIFSGYGKLNYDLTTLRKVKLLLENDDKTRK